MNPLDTPDLHKRSWVVDVASAMLAVGTWGIESGLRREMADERAADLAAQLRDERRNSTRAVLARCTRTLAADIMGRLTSDRVTAIPIALASLIAGTGTLLYALLQPLPDYRLSLVVNGVGFFILGAFGLRSPLAIRRAPSAFGCLMLAIGSAIGVVVIPNETAASLFYFAAMAALALASFGFGSLAIGLLLEKDDRIHLLGATLLGAGFLLAFAEIGWAVYVSRTNPIEAVAAVLTAAGALLFVRFFGRLRFLPVEKGSARSLVG